MTWLGHKQREEHHDSNQFYRQQSVTSTQGRTCILFFCAPVDILPLIFLIVFLRQKKKGPVLSGL